MNSSLVWTFTKTYGAILSPVVFEQSSSKRIDRLFSQRMYNYRQKIQAFYRANPELRGTIDETSK